MPSTISAGTASGTALNLSGDTTGNLAFQTNGTTTAMTITTGQNVGIGTTSPNLTGSGKAITVNASSAGDYAVYEMASGGTLNGYMTANNGQMYIAASGARSMYLQTNSAIALSIDTSQNVSMQDKYFINGRSRQYSNGVGGFGGWTLQTYNGGWADAITVDGNGNTGIGTASPSQKLQVQGVINFATVNAGQTGVGAGFQDGATMFLGSDFQNPNSMSGTTNASFKFSTSRTGCIAASNNGSYVYEGFTSATGSRSFAVLSNGNVQNTNNSYGSLSDATIKQDIVDAGSQWNDIKNLKVRKYRFIEEVEQNPDAKPQIGLVAQEAETISPGLVDKQIIYKQKLDSDGNTIPDAYGTPEMEVDKELKTIKYSVLYMKAVKALQEAMERIETLEAKVNALEGAK